jgi:hypothetical protein
MPLTAVLLSVPLVFLLGMLAAGLAHRLEFGRGRHAFRAKMRSPDKSWPVPPQWPRRRVRAAWVHDVLLVQRGLLRPRTVALPVRGPDHPIRAAGRIELAGLGSLPVVITLRLDDGRMVDIAAREADRTALAGPFLAAAISGLPRAAKEPKHRGN